MAWVCWDAIAVHAEDLDGPRGEFFFCFPSCLVSPWDVRILAEYHPGLGGVQWYIG